MFAEKEMWKKFFRSNETKMIFAIITFIVSFADSLILVLVLYPGVQVSNLIQIMNCFNILIDLNMRKCLPYLLLKLVQINYLKIVKYFIN